MEFGLKGKAILVTGSTQGVGAAIAREAARQGAEKVAIAGRNAVNGGRVARELEQLGAQARYFPADLSQPDAPHALFAAVLAWAGSVDGPVNSAGITTRASVVDATLEQWEAIVALNVRAPFFMMQAFVRHRLALGLPGSIVNIQSMNAHCGIPELAIYSATKGALATLTRNVANAHMRDRIRVNGINMGWSPTDGERNTQARVLGRGEDWLEAVAATQPLKRLLEPEEVGRLAAYLLSDYSGLQTGTSIDLEQVVLGAWNAG